MNKRPDWDEIWMKVAETIALRSHHPEWKVGAVIVSSDNTQVLSLGYNGNASGMSNEPQSILPGQSGLLHAEINALLKLDYNNPKDKIMYITLMPCVYCSKAIINSGIKTVPLFDEIASTILAEVFSSRSDGIGEMKAP